MPSEPLLTVRDLTISFATSDGDVLQIVRDADFTIHRGEVAGLVGESGCGKTVTSLSLMGLLGPPARISGSARFGNTELFALTPRQWEPVRGKRIAMIFQDPMGSLNPVYRAGRQVAEALAARNGSRGSNGANSTERVLELFTRVGITHPEARFREYPHALSGGMCQRVSIAMALAGEPELLIADEPTTALDVTIQAQILDLLLSLRNELGLSILLITHDLGIVAEYCDYVHVMYAGKIVERGPARALFEDPVHPYTRGLLDAIPVVHAAGAPLKPIPGSVPNLRDMPEGCPFVTRCPVRVPACEHEMPVTEELESRRSAACHRLPAARRAP
jgi:peptide/nickel transport system ATP-binding protein